MHGLNYAIRFYHQFFRILKSRADATIVLGSLVTISQSYLIWNKNIRLDGVNSLFRILLGTVAELCISYSFDI